MTFVFFRFSVKIYDGRFSLMDMESEAPYSSLPLFSGNLHPGDLVWLGFQVRTRQTLTGFRDELEFPVQWVVLLQSKHSRDLLFDGLH